MQRYFTCFRKHSLDILRNIVKYLVKILATFKDCGKKRRENIFMLRSREGKNYILHAHELRQREKAVKIKQKISEP